MKAVPRFARKGRAFWAHVRLVSERIGYSERVKRGAEKRMRRYTVEDVVKCLQNAELKSEYIVDARGRSSMKGKAVLDYLNARAKLLENEVYPNLMDRDQARREFERLKKRLKPRCALPFNKQKREKRHPAYLTCIVNMLTEDALRGRTFVDTPRGLTIITLDGHPHEVFSRWMDGAFPSQIDPIAVWEVKEYYGTKTFGSRVADGVYESMLDGHEFRKLEKEEGRRIEHYLIVDDRFTWWGCGRSYLCRLIDMLHVGLVDEVLFGREVLTRWPAIVRSWP